MKKTCLFLGLVMISVFVRGGTAEPLLESDFEMTKHGSFSNGIFTVSVSPEPHIPNQTLGMKLQFKKAKFAGKSVRFSAQMRCRDINSDSTGPHIGGKILTAYSNSAGIASYYSSKGLTGTHDEWQNVSCFCSFPADMKSAAVVFGIQQGWGTLEFRNPTYEIVSGKTTKISIPDGFSCKYTEEIAKRPAMRGVMSPPPNRITEQDIHDMAQWNVNLLRYQMVDGIRDLKDLKEYDLWINSMLNKLEELIPQLKKYGIRVIIDMHRPPGGRYANSAMLQGTAGEKAAEAYGNSGRFRMMEEPIYRDAFLETWRQIAKRFKGNPVIYGYDLVNEPDQRGPAKFDWLELQFDAARAIREIDQETPIVVSGNRWSSPVAFGQMVPLPLKNIIYQVHMYEPGDYTHQGVGNKLYGDTYPKESWDYRERGWSREKLEQAMKPVIDFQKKYDSKILIGEFSVTIWAPGAANYLEDVISIFEKHGWDWTYHAFREWPGWSVEHAGVPNNIQPAADSDRKDVLLKYFRKNIKPGE